MTTKIQETDYATEMKQSFIDYAMTTITDRALPDVRDGMKPVHRRILYGMSSMGLSHTRPHKKSARIVGDVMGKYHPHGDSSVYMSMVRLAQDFSLKLPLVDGHGNFGSIDGDEAAAMRYTEARLSGMSEWLLNDLDKGTVDFKPNYDDSEREPTVLPARFPNLIINGTEGIATGMATSIPTHNPKEVADAWLYVLQTENPTIQGVMKHLSAPDLPMGGVIVNKEEMEGFYKTGSARIITRGEYAVEDASYGKKNVIFTSLPMKAVGSKTNLINHLIAKVNDKVLDEVTDIRDESSREGTRLVIELRKGTNVDHFMNKLWVKTNMQDAHRLHFLVLVDGQPKTLNILEYFQHYITFQKEVIERHHQFLLNQTNKRLHLVEGLLIAHENMDAVIEALRGSKTVEDSRNCLMSGEVTGVSFRLKKNELIASKFTFSKEQTDAILAMRLQKLVGLERKELEKEKEDLLKRQAYHAEVVSSEDKRTELSVEEANAFKKTFERVERITTVTTQTTKAVQEISNVRPVVAVIDRFGLIKLADRAVESDETVKFQLETDTSGRIAVFTNTGNLYQVKCKDIPEVKKNNRGVPLQLIAKMKPDEVILLAITEKELETSSFVFVSEKGKGKLVEGKEFMTNRLQLVATKLQAKDQLANVIRYNGKSTLIVETYQDKIKEILIKDVPVFGRNAQGNYLFRLGKNDKVVNTHFK